MHATPQTTGPTPLFTIRAPRKGDGRQVARYADQAMHGQKDAGWLNGVAAQVDAGEIETTHEFGYSSKSRGITGSVVSDPYMRVLDLGERAPSGMIYSIQPMNWILEQKHVALDWPAIVGRFVEVNLLAVHKSHRGKGYGSQLLAETESRYRHHGYSLAMVIIDHEHDPTLRGWYERRGYTFTEPGERPVIQMRAASSATRAVYSHYDDDQLAGFKALTDAVTIGRRMCTGILTPASKRPVDVELLTVAGVLD